VTSFFFFLWYQMTLNGSMSVMTCFL
jgi:hypothetical protein